MGLGFLLIGSGIGYAILWNAIAKCRRQYDTQINWKDVVSSVASVLAIGIGGWIVLWQVVIAAWGLIF